MLRTMSGKMSVSAVAAAAPACPFHPVNSIKTYLANRVQASSVSKTKVAKHSSANWKAICGLTSPRVAWATHRTRMPETQSGSASGC
jgi:hypothetical protein